MGYSIKRKFVNTVHIIQETSNSSKGTEIIFQPVEKDCLHLWIGNEGEYYEENNVDFQAINLTYQDAELLVHTLQEVMKQIKDI
jgi:hypothetical protein